MISLYEFPEIEEDEFDPSDNYIDEFRDKFENYIGKYHCYLTNSARTSIFFIIKNVLNPRRNDEIVVPAYTCWSVVKAVERVCKPVFVDIDNRTFNIDPELIEEKITGKTRAIIPVHLYGNSCQMDRIMEIAAEKNLIVIEDCAQAVGAELKGKKTGSFGDFSVFSFSKDLNCGGGGAILSDRKIDINYKCKFEKMNSKKRLYDIVSMNPRFYCLFKKNILLPYINHKSKKIEEEVRSLSNFKCFFLLEQLKKHHSKIESRRKNSKYLSRHLPFKSQREIGKSSSYRYSVLLANRDAVAKKLMTNGIDVGFMYDYYCSRIGTCPESEKASREMLNLPVNHDTKKAELDFIIEKLNDYENMLH